MGSGGVVGETNWDEGEVAGGTMAKGECAEGVEASLCLPKWRVSCLIRVRVDFCPE
ncbi:protein of unknown function [Limnospira indica PCC 8005]|uniref:Uncharacterized protein n=1 Tax=Limnospira indica PCC 8005 TaxID=376219 RepID=A0A9P1KDQ4_9CYAN|nr:protein of unknown function [Limnospira indica PCC 8005]